MDVLNVLAQKREATGKKHNKIVRKSGRIPATIYGGGENINISVTHNEVKKLIYTPDFKLADIDVDGTSHKAIIKEMQFHPLTEAILHIDFLKIVEGSPIKVEVPILFKGVSPGVKTGGKLIQQMRRVKIKTLPKNLVDRLYVNISSLELGDAVRVRDLEIGEGIEVMTEGATPIALVEIPRALKSAAAAEAKAGGGEVATAEK